MSNPKVESAGSPEKAESGVHGKSNVKFADIFGLETGGETSPQAEPNKEQTVRPFKEFPSTIEPPAVIENKPGVNSASTRSSVTVSELDRQPLKASTVPSDASVAKAPVGDPVVKATGAVSPVADATLKVAAGTTSPADTTKLNLFPSPTAFDSSTKSNVGSPKVEGAVQPQQTREVGQSSDKPVDQKPVERAATSPVADQLSPTKSLNRGDAHDAPIPASTAPQPVRDNLGTDPRTKSEGPSVSALSNSSKADLPNQKFSNSDVLPSKELAQARSINPPPVEARGDVKSVDGKPVETKVIETRPSSSSSSSNDLTGPRDIKASGVANEVLGAKPIDSREPSGAKSDFVNTINNKVDQAVAGKLPQGETHSDGGAVGGKQSTTNDATTSTNPTGKQTATEAGGAAGKQPTAADVANTGSRQPATEVGGRPPGSGGGGGTGVPDAATSTHKNESVNNPGSKGDNSAGTGSAGSSAPTDRAPHKPFGVEDSQGTKSISTDGKLPDGSGMKTADAAGGKVAEGVGGKVADGVGSGKTPAGASATGPRFDVGETKVSTPGSPGAPGSGSAGGATAAGAGSGRFDVPDLKVGSGTGSGGGGSQIESTQIPGQKGFDVTGGKSMPEGIMNQGAKSPIGRVGEGIKVGDDNPVVLPGMIAGREGGRKPNEQVIGEKPNQAAVGGKPASDDTVVKGPKDNTSKPSEVSGVPVISGPADMGGALRNFAQSVLSTDKGDQTAGKGPSAGKDPVKSQPVEEGPKTFAGPGQKTTVLGADSNEPGRRAPGASAVPGEIGKGSSASGIPGGKKDESGFGEVSSEGESSESAPDLVPLEEFALPSVDLLAESDQSAEIDELVNEAGDAEEFDERTYELALGLQLYNAVAEAQYGAYHYLTREGDTVELVSRDVVGDPRTAPLVFSINKEHILASTEYGVHPFKVGVMIQLPTPREIKIHFGPQTK